MRIGTDPPIEGAEVFIDEASVGLTGADGSLTVTEVTAGPHTIRAHKDGYVDDSATISVPETTSVTLTLTFIKLGTEVRLSSDKTSYAVGEHAYLTQGLYDDAGNLISGRTVDYTVTLDGVWYAGWGQYSDDPSRDMILSKEGTYTITGNFVGDDTYKPSSKTITITARKTGTSVGISSDKTSYTAGETAHLTLGLYDEYGSIIDHSKIVDYTVTLNGAWYAGWGQYGDDPARDLILSEAGTYVITGDFPGDDTYEPSSKTLTITAITRTYTITIHVEGSGPIEGAEVLLDGVSVGLTDSIGVLTIPEVTAGSHTIEARKEGYSPDSTTVSVPKTTSVTLALARLVYTVTVTVTGSGPIVGAAVYFDGAYVGSTNTAGSITITEVTTGSHTIRASKSGYHDASKTISVPKTTSVTLTLTRLVELVASIVSVDAPSSADAGADFNVAVTLRNDGNSAGNLYWALTDKDTGENLTTSDGRGPWFSKWFGVGEEYSWTESYRMPNKDFRLTLAAGHWREEPHEFITDETREFTVVLTPIFEVTLDGYVRDSSTGKPIQGAKVNVWVNGVATSYTDSSGHYGPFGGLPEGGVTLTASARGYEDYSETITLVKGSNRKDIALAPAPPIYMCPYCGQGFSTQAELDAHIATVHARITIGVKVTEEDGTPIAGAGVQVGGVGGVWDTGSDGIAWVSGYLKNTTGSIRVATPDGRSAYDAHKFTYDHEVYTITVPPAPIEITARAEVTWAPTGEPIPNVRIHFDTVDVRTDYYGKASFRVIKDKPYWVNIDNPRGWTETFYAMVWAYNYQEIRFGLRLTY